ncbi:hypothetical protein XENOCAPTIV_028184 [Xenoophorus captivus]|uniref:CCHC-type domain-containing protein n=1 Tax=Xenoophorus captivus TaxID=1517983 RepID=A0ABV0SH50_9TELE
MLEVAGTNEPQLVFRPWTAADIQASAALLPDPVEDGRKFATEFKALCHEMRPTGREIRRLLAAKIKPGDLVGLRLPDPAVRLGVTTGGEDGMERPADFTVLGPWEKMLCGYIMEGLLPEIAAQTKTLYVGWRHGVRFEELKRHALHSDDVINDKKKKKADKRETDLHNAALTLYYSTNQRGSFPRGRGQGRRGRGRGRGQWSRSDACHNCGKLGHWRNECPEKLQRPDSGN